MVRTVFQSIIFILIPLILPIQEINAQAKLEGGPYIGVSWYNGDLNPQRQFYRIHPAIGGIIRYSVNDRIAFRGGASLVGISGAYPAKDVYLPDAENVTYSFKRNLIDITALTEINFFSFDHPHNREAIFTPYATLGFGTTIYKRYREENDNHTEKPTFVLSLPFGAGVKWKVNSWMKLGAEWTFRKTFTDDLDLIGFNNPIDPSDPYRFNQNTLSHNNDWYSVVGLYMTFSIFSRRDKCHDGF